MRVGYLVSSHVSYAAPRAHLLRTLGGLSYRVVIGEGGPRAVTAEGVAVPYRAFDYTALIDYAEHPEDYPDWTHVFLLHDTCEAGPDMDRLVHTADPQARATAVWGGQCNLALYRADELRARAADLAALKGCTKTQSVAREGFLWRTLPPAERGHYAGGCVEGLPVPVYGGALRMPEHYTGVDLIKYKANWGQNATQAEARWIIQP